MSFKIVIAYTLGSALLGAIVGALFVHVLFFLIWLGDSLLSPDGWLPLIYERWLPYVFIGSAALAVGMALNAIIVIIKWQRKYGLKW